jgi:hypothetical protein
MAPLVELEVLAAQAVSGADAQALRELEILLERLRQNAGDEKIKVDLDRLHLEQKRMQHDLQQQVEASKVQLDELMRQRTRMRQMVERGLISHDELAKVENRIQEAELTMAQARERMNVHLKDLVVAQEALKDQAAAQRLHQADLAKVFEELQAQERGRDRQLTQAQVAELERAAREYRQIMGIYKLQMEQRQTEQRELRARAVGGRTEAVSPREERLLAETRPETSATEPIRAGDVLSVEITGESDLPRAYLVQTDGTVRLPILGSIKVAGLTAQQAGQAITKQISRVNSSASAHVSLRRPRTDERRQR